MVERRPKAGYAAKIKSHIRMTVMEKHQIDLVDPKVFPDQKRRWQSFVDVLAKDGAVQNIDIKFYFYIIFLTCRSR